MKVEEEENEEKRDNTSEGKMTLWVFMPKISSRLHLIIYYFNSSHSSQVAYIYLYPIITDLHDVEELTNIKEGSS